MRGTLSSLVILLFSSLMFSCQPLITVPPAASQTPTLTLTPTASPTLSATPMPTQTSIPLTSMSLRELADKAGIKIGVLFNLSTEDIQKTTRQEFNLGVTWTGWNWTEQSPNHFNLSSVDYDVQFARRNKMDMCGHMLVWPAPEQIPEWVRKSPREELINILKNHITKIVSPYKGRIHCWIVVNEAMNYYTAHSDFFYERIGIEYIDIVFQTVREIDPDAILIYNDFANETLSGVRYKHTQEIVQRLMANELIDGVGLEMHLFADNPPSKQDVIDAMRSYGIPVYVTEFDVILKNVAGTTEERFERQALVYKEVVEACLESRVCRSIVIFGIKDDLSTWEHPLSNSIHWSNADALIFDDNLQAKPAYYAIKDAIISYIIGQQLSPTATSSSP